MITFYTDGACNGNKSGGWAIYSPELDLRLCGHKDETTNNRMELFAIMKVMELVHKMKVENETINVYSDSAWALGVVDGNWNATKNTDLIDVAKAYRTFLEKQKLNFIFTKCEGHKGIEGNEICDTLAVIMSNNECN